jgi:hypothetical protein
MFSTMNVIIHLFGFLPIFVEPKDNKTLMLEVGKEELLKNIQRFQRDRSPSLFGLPIEFFLNYFYFIGNDISKENFRG